MTQLSYCAAQVRRYDYDRYLAGLFFPQACREDLYALLAFNLEVAKTREVVTEPMLGRIRLQWWREAIAEIFDGGTARQHQVAQPLADAIRNAALPRAPFERLIDGREFDLEDVPPPSLEALIGYVDQTVVTQFQLSASLLGEGAVAAATPVGRAWGLTGLIRAIPHHARQNRLYIPADIQQAVGLRARDILDRRPTDAGAAAVAELALAAKAEFEQAQQMLASRTSFFPALLPIVLVPLYLDRVAAVGANAVTDVVELSRLRRQVRLWRAARRGRL